MKRTTVFGFLFGLTGSVAAAGVGCNTGDCIRDSDCDGDELCVAFECVPKGGDTDTDGGTDSATSTTAATDSGGGGTDGTCMVPCFQAAQNYNIPSAATPFPVGTTCPEGVGDLSEQAPVLIPQQAIATVCPVVDNAGGQTILDACACPPLAMPPPNDPAWSEYVILFTDALRDSCQIALNVAYGCSVGVAETAALCDTYLVNEVAQRLTSQTADACILTGSEGATVPWTCDYDTLTCG